MAERLTTVGLEGEALGSEAWHASWSELLLAMAWRGLCADLIWVDAPYSPKTHGGHADGATTANRAKDWAARNPGHDEWGNKLAGQRAWQKTYSEAGKGERRAINYAPWTPSDVRDFVRAWVPFCAGWFVTITDHVLAPHWSNALERAGLYVFSPVAYVAPGSRVRMLGDGPPTWCNTVIHARLRSREMARWGTAAARAARGDAPALLGAYVDPSEQDMEGAIVRLAVSLIEAGVDLDGLPRSDPTLAQAIDLARVLPRPYVLPPGEGGAGKLDVVGGKPRWLHEQIVERYSAPGALVVDPCGGGGGAGRAAVKLGRRAIVGDSLREHAELCATALHEGVEAREAAQRAAAYLPAPPRPEQAALPFGSEFHRPQVPKEAPSVVEAGVEVVLAEMRRNHVLPFTAIPVAGICSRCGAAMLGPSCTMCGPEIDICTCPSVSEYDPPCPRHGVVGLTFAEHPEVP